MARLIDGAGSSPHFVYIKPDGSMGEIGKMMFDSSGSVGAVTEKEDRKPSFYSSLWKYILGGLMFITAVCTAIIQIDNVRKIVASLTPSVPPQATEIHELDKNEIMNVLDSEITDDQADGSMQAMGTTDKGLTVTNREK